MPSVDVVSLDRRKRARHEPRNGLESTKPRAVSRAYTPFRSIGHVSNHVPFDIQIKGTQFLLTTCIGRAIQTYDCAKLNLLFVGTQTPETITAVVSQSDLILVAAGPSILAMKRGKEVWKIVTEDEEDIVHMITFGSYICATTTKQQLLIYNTSTLELHTQIALRAETEITALLHPATYLNKIVIATTDGRLEIWNVRTGSMIHRTESFGNTITALASAPVVDVIAVGLLDGSIFVYHLRADERMYKLRQEGRVTSITFRTDGIQTMASANDTGAIALWDLEKSKIQHVMRTAHVGSIPSIQFLNGQPLLLSSGTDNSIKEWLFDASDGLPRLLRSRSGHHAPPTSIDFYGETSQFLLSASRDRSVRAFSIYSDAQTAELSQGAVQSAANKSMIRAQDLKLPEVTALASRSTREKDWDNVLTAHKEDRAARSWSWSKRRLGSHQLRTFDGAAVRSVAISACGNFGFVGSNRGTIDCYNMQSGLHRRTYKGPDPHTKAVSGITSDSLNKVMISTSLDGTVKFWDFHKGVLLSTTNVQIGITALRYHRESGLVALSCDDFCIRILDTETKKLVRELWGHSNRLSSVVFSDDGRWLVSAALDSTIRTWDLPTGHLIDAIRTQSVCTSLSFSPTGEYLATTHIDSVGVHLWTNKAQFTPISTRHITEEEIVEAEMPSASGEGGTGIIDLALNDEEDNKDGIVLDSFNTVDQLSTDLLTLSMVPKSKWQNLLNLDVIRQRNKPKEAPRAPERLPFDLGTLRDLRNGSGLAAANVDGDDGATQSRFLDLHTSTTSQFSALLASSAEDDDDDASGFMEYLKTLGPAQLDIEVQSLSPGDSFAEHKNFTRAMTGRLRARRDYELCQAYMATFFKAHGDIIAGSIDDDGELERVLLDWQAVQESERQRLADLVGFCNGVVRFFTVK
ncbi:Uncharacterized WD repeat-containing protein C1672.07 [Taphrina deformans PYCC 5710]|uniref:Uncharacterized WD repeat-containing protein C1672.07 n=1 Tax=Taphrina deformans (strain PYCC 5710 / ATCC 11124 / CBS 356.35 / IMI 108563 / JCM 9778 / NBRC 8474) TaxID=1097556 RepID=R4X6I5_TAPDE|nr:Uncharacterized WD repeat-containing protein C1672.07 [Taphrina deformans PYCC 5710]|eukprot:CCG80725.1 Uncharacterized WD repeat-containing protein C1672.07 [Taphrina deformans PYCC 5710]